MTGKEWLAWREETLRQDSRDLVEAFSEQHPVPEELQREKAKFGGVRITPSLIRTMGHFFAQPVHA